MAKENVKTGVKSKINTRVGRKSKEKKVEEQPLHIESVTQNDLTWINIEPPSERETEYLAQNYPFHPLDLDDCLSRIQRPKIDEYKDYIFLVLHFPVFNPDARVTNPSQLSVFISEKYVITLHKGDLKPIVALFRDCELNEDTREEHFSNGTGYLLYRIIDRLVDYCLPIISKISANIEKTEDNIFQSRRMPKAIGDISALRRDVIAFRRIIWPMRAVVATLEPKIRRFTSMDMAPYFGDMIDHVDKIWDALDEFKEIIEGLNDTHDSLATNHTNEVMRMLTIIATVLLPLTLLAGIYGMNVPLPFQDSHYSFILIFIVWVIIVSGMLYFFRRNRWI
jgi:magnesium transporter